MSEKIKRKGDQELANPYRQWQHWTHKTQDEDEKNTTQETKKDAINGPYQKNRGGGGGER